MFRGNFFSKIAAHPRMSLNVSTPPPRIVPPTVCLFANCKWEIEERKKGEGKGKRGKEMENGEEKEGKL